MAEMVKILSPRKKVLLANPIAGCPMADQMYANLSVQMKSSMPDYTVVAYINTSAELKTVCDVCATVLQTDENTLQIRFDEPQRAVKIFI